MYEIEDVSSNYRDERGKNMRVMAIMGFRT